MKRVIEEKHIITGERVERSIRKNDVQMKRRRVADEEGIIIGVCVIILIISSILLDHKPFLDRAR